jgi:hypothetical protein
MMVRRDGDWISATVGAELMMMSAERGVYLGVTAVGRRIWELIEQPRDLAEICERLEAEFEVTPETCRAEVEEFLTELAAKGAVVLDSAPAG